MSWQRVADFPAESDLAALHQWLSAQRYPHRFSIEGDLQILWTPYAELVEPLANVVRRYEAGDGLPEIVAASAEPPGQGRAIPAAYAPATLGLLLLSFAGSALFSFGDELIRLFTFYDLSPFYRSRSAFADILDGQFWRLLSPMFLHFGFLHIAFNAMWLWYLGSRLEQVLGSSRLLLLVAGIGLISNVAQALVSYPIPFGGMSGVVFGLLGYFWIRGRFRPHPSLYMPPSLFPIMMALMLISAFGAFDWMSGAEVADTAHISGLVAGLVIGLALLALPGRSDEP